MPQMNKPSLYFRTHPLHFNVSCKSNTIFLLFYQMQSNEIVQQLSSFACNLVQVADVLHSLSGSSGTFDTRIQMNEAKTSLLDTLVLLNTFLVAQNSANNACDVYPGSLVLAPRLFQGTLCWDFAIVTQITENCRPILTTTSTTRILNQYSFRTSEHNDESEITISVLWLRPQTQYEHFSHNITFASSQLRQPQDAVQYWQEQEAALSIVHAADDVLYLNTDYSNPQAGVWLPAKVNSVRSVAHTAATVTLIPHNTRNNAANHQTPITIPLTMSKVTLLPRSASDYSRTSVSTSQSRNQINATSVPSHSVYSDSESDTEDDLYAGITSLPSYADRHTSKNTSSASLSALANGPPGTWEKHTKGMFRA